MNLKEYKAGSWVKQIQYKSFLPSSINHTWTWDDPSINVLLEKATKEIGELNAFSMILPDVDLFIRMHIVKEANTSSRIEGTQTNMEEVLMKKELVSPEKKDDWQEVNNYITAINDAIDQLQDFPVSSRLLRHTHKILLNSTRGERKSPGEFRMSQNWIGGSNLTDAVFIPPHFSEVGNLISDLEKFIHNEEALTPHLIKAAIVHYQFETIHPFLDGNGRIGRLLIPLYLISNNVIAKPTLYLSDFFEKNRASYFDALMYVRNNSDMAHWIKFFLNAVISTAQNGKTTFQKIFALKNSVQEKIILMGRQATSAHALINGFYQNPFLNLADAVKITGLSKQSANKLLNNMIECKLITESSGKQRNKIYFFKDYYEVFLQ